MLLPPQQGRMKWPAQHGTWGGGITYQQKAWSKAAASLLREDNLSMSTNLINLLMKRVKEGNLLLISPDQQKHLFFPSQRVMGLTVIYISVNKQLISHDSQKLTMETSRSPERDRGGQQHGGQGSHGCRMGHRPVLTHTRSNSRAPALT